MLGIGIMTEDFEHIGDINLQRYSDIDSITNALNEISNISGVKIKNMRFEGTNYRVPNTIADSGVISAWLEWKDAYLDIEMNINVEQYLRQCRDTDAAQGFALWFTDKMFYAHEIQKAKEMYFDYYMTTCEDEFEAGVVMIEDKLGHKIPTWLDCYVLFAEFCRRELYYTTIYNRHSGRIHVLKKGRWK